MNYNGSGPQRVRMTICGCGVNCQLIHINLSPWAKMGTHDSRNTWHTCTGRSCTIAVEPPEDMPTQKQTNASETTSQRRQSRAQGAVVGPANVAAVWLARRPEVVAEAGAGQARDAGTTRHSQLPPRISCADAPRCTTVESIVATTTHRRLPSGSNRHGALRVQSAWRSATTHDFAKNRCNRHSALRARKPDPTLEIAVARP